MSRVRVILWVLVAIALVALAFMMFRPVPETRKNETITLASIGGPFTLTGADGRPFSSARLSGKPYAIFFGFTNCPDVCPTTLARLIQLRKQLNAGDRSFEIVFVTVDPERDTKDVLTTYLAAFDPNIIGLVGNADQTAAAKASFGVFSEKGQADKTGSYLVNHTATVFLVGKNGEFEGTIDYGEDTKSAEAKVKRLIGG